MKAFIDYAYYHETYGGTDVSPELFNRLALEASYKINEITFGKAENDTEHLEEIKLATCAVIDKINKINGDGGIKQSETVGNYSVTYANINNNTDENKLYYKAAYAYLADTGLLYRGVR